MVASIKLQLRYGDRSAARRELAEIVQWRRANQPGGRNAGSVFTNPEHAAAGALIESAGAKGLRMGSAEVSSKHANFIQSDEGGCAADIVAVMREVRRRVKADHGMELAVETRLVGFEAMGDCRERDGRSRGPAHESAPHRGAAVAGSPAPAHTGHPGGRSAGDRSRVRYQSHAASGRGPDIHRQRRRRSERGDPPERGLVHRGCR